MPDTKSPQHRYPAELRERAVRMVFETIEQRKERYGVVTRVAHQLGIGTESLRSWPFDKDLTKAASQAFDRRTGRRVPRSQLKRYREAVGQYHLHPEAKFVGGDYAACGSTTRRHVTAAIVTYIGKEANEWERQFHLGTDETAAIVYGTSVAELARLQASLSSIRRVGIREASRQTKVSASEISMVSRGLRRPSRSTMVRMATAKASGDQQRTSADRAVRTRHFCCPDG